MKFALLICCVWTLSQCSGKWVPLPQIPSGRRSEYYLLQNEGGYKYGLDTGTGIFAKQSATAENQVKGHYGYQVGGKVIDVKYTAGVQGFVPEIPESNGGLASNLESYSPVIPINRSSVQNPDGSYSFSYESGGSTRTESRDRSGHVEGQYSYNDDSGHHDLSYKAGPETGFVPNGGNLATPNGIGSSMSFGSYLSPKSETSPATIDSGSLNPDESYTFGYSTVDSARIESGDANRNVQGQYLYTNEAGNHDLSYIAGSETGFLETGGSLAGSDEFKVKDLLGVNDGTPETYLTASEESFSSEPSSSNPDESYNFAYSTIDSARSESSDSNGHIQGQYSYRNEAGNHDLSYIAGPETGFVVTGGSLSAPNGLKGKDVGGGSDGSLQKSTSRVYLPPTDVPTSSTGSSSSNPDGSYSFVYETKDSARSESGDSSGHVQGHYSYQNEAGNHDLTYIAGPEIGFSPTGGSLVTPNGLKGKNLGSSDGSLTSISKAYQSPNIGVTSPIRSSSSNSDGSYSFNYSTGDSTRIESGDANGNVQGQYSYTNEAGNHDLSYIAGPETGFVATGGSLSVPNGLKGKDLGDGYSAHGGSLSISTSRSYLPPSGEESSSIGFSSSNPDGTYSFSYSTRDSARSESGDSSGHVQGKYSFKNAAGNHDLSYISGPETGFVATGGSLSVPNGLKGKELTTFNNIDNIKQTSNSSPSKIYRSFGDLKALDVLPISDNYKSGYILY